MKDLDNTLEKREQTRYEGVYAEYALIDDRENVHDPDFKAGFIRNFSRGGSSLQVYDNIDENTLVWVKLYDPNIRVPIEALGGLAWKARDTQCPPGNRDRYDIGIKFLYLDEDNKHRLGLMIEYFENMKPKSSGMIEYM